MLGNNLKLLASLHARALTGSGSVVVICGESGLGKTYTVETFLASLNGADVVLRASGRPQTSKPLYPLYEALTEYLGKAWWRRYAQPARDLAVALPYVGSWLKPLLPDSSPGVSAGLPGDIFTERSQYPHLLDFIRRSVKKQPALFWIDSVQWVDQETLEFLKYLRNHAAGGNILWILSINPHAPGISSPAGVEQFLAYYRAAADREDVRFCELRPYRRESLESLMGRILGAPVELDTGSANLLYERTQGVPYIVKTVMDLLRQEGQLVFERGTFRLAAPLQELSLPASLMSAIGERLRTVYRSVPAARGILEAAAVIGEQFEDATLDAVLDLCDTYTLLNTIEEQQHLVRNLLEQRRWEFEHVTIRDFIYSSLGRTAARIHTRLAEHLVATGCDDSSQVAFHFRAAGNTAAAVLYSLRHARQCLQHGFFREAQRTLDELWESGDIFSHPEYAADRFGIHYDRALSYYYTGAYEEALRQLASLHDAPGPEEVMRVGLLLAQCLNKGSHPGDFTRAAEILEELAAQPAPRGLTGRVLAELVVSYAHLNRYADARHVFVRADRLLSQSDQPLERAQLMRKACIFYEPELSIPILKRAVEVARRRRIDHEVVRALTNLSTEYLFLADFERARLTIESALRVGEELGGFGMDYLLNNLAIVHLRSGNVVQGVALLQRALEHASRAVNQLILRVNQAACILADRGPGEAAELLLRLLDEAMVIGEEMYTTAIRLNLAAAYRALGRYAAALEQLAACDTGLAEFDPAYGEQRTRLLLGVLQAAGALHPGRPVPPRRSIGAHPEIYLVDMQFWGD
ncbi:ATP-binding protein [Longimicrobium sp.]|uniref:ATP-binding protein n=1 Tax=Longimicrobium sp. TaxID=2029185 RepID=UPI002E35CD55|nr:AAA family ATPase [Longimicrobium sp.]HEX6040931.1 AAA family ATPase [Longimicrobium sp.]